MAYSVDSAKWQTLSLDEQLGNIGSEVGRTFNALKAGDKDRARGAVTRALDLFDATTSNPKLSAPRRREILRAKEEYLKNYLAGHDNGVETYFMRFAIAARN